MEYFDIARTTVQRISKECKNRDEAITLVVGTLKQYNNDWELRRALENELYKERYDISVDSILGRSEVDTRKLQNYIWEAHKSKENTDRLVKFIQQYPNNHQVLFASWHALKIKYLLELGILESTKELENEKETSLKRTIFSCDEEESKISIYNCIETLIGMNPDEDHFIFKLNIESLFYDMENNDVTQGYKKANTIKVALNILKPEYLQHEVNGKMKLQYFENVAKRFNDCIKLIDKKVAKRIVDKTDIDLNVYGVDGYTVFYNLLKNIV